MTIEMTNTPADVNALFADFGSTNKADLRVSKKEYSATSVTTMAERIVARIQQTIVAIEQFDSWDKPIKAAPLTAPMATRELGGFTVKIGTGAKNEAFGIAARHFKMNRDGNEKDEANLFLQAVREHLEQGTFDALIEAKLNEYRERAELGKAARKSNKIQPEKESNITELNAA